MTSKSAKHTDENWQRISYANASTFIEACLTRAGADIPSAAAVTRSLAGASLRGIDSHGIRLLPHYVEVLQKGRINARPNMQFTAMTNAAGQLDADNGFGHLAGYRAVEEGIKLTEKSGLAAVSIINSSHFGAAGSYALAAAEAGYVALLMSNSDKLVLAHDGVAPFHGTNPVSFAAPIADEKPYLVDMATSSIPYNRVMHYRSIERDLPHDVAVDANGNMTTDPFSSTALLPLGGLAFGFKGVALAGICEVLCAAMSGMGFSHQLLPIHGEDMSSKRHLGHFALLMKPDLFLPMEQYQQHFKTYLADLRSLSATEQNRVMAPGDREWSVQTERELQGIPVDPQLWTELEHLAQALKVNLFQPLQ